MAYADKPTHPQHGGGPIRVTPRIAVRRALPRPPLAPVLLLGWCAALFLYGLAAGPLYRTESLRAIIGAEALRGHWLYPVLHGEPFLTKPPGHYAAIALASLPLGRVTEVTARLPSAVAATVTVLLMAGLFRRVLGDRAGLLAGLLVPCSILWLDKAPSAEIDMTLVGWVTAGLVAFWCWVEAEERGDAPASRRVGFALASLLCIAAGTLTKWTAPAFFALTAVPLLAWRGRLRLLVGWPFLLAVGAGVAAVAGWAALVTQQIGWDGLADTVRKEAAYRFAPRSAAKGYPWTEVVTYPLLVWAAHLPLSLFALRTVRRGFAAHWDDRGRLLLAFLHCWAWPNLLFWALVPNHNVRYALPLSPALMGLGVMGLMDWWWRRSPEPPNPPGPPSLRGKGGDEARSVLAPVDTDTTSREAAHLEHPSPSGGGAGGGVDHLRNSLGFAGLPLRHGRSPVPVLATFLALWLVAKVVFVEVVVPRRTAGRNAEATAALLRELVPPGEPLYLLKLKDEGVLFYYGRPTRKLSSPAELPRAGYAVLLEAEWREWEANRAGELVRWMYDQQGAPLILARVTTP
ncbi:MAG TPA: glycosyltransferase family 39 protein [Urbifossiella sp.]|nr:glycosyltransferase family 39 protein [Urbifossiella sp.]